MRKMLNNCGAKNLFNGIICIFLGMMIFTAVLGISRARASGQTIEELQAENEELRNEVSSNESIINSLVDELNQLNTFQEQTIKMYEDQCDVYEREIKKLKKKLEKAKQKKKEVQIKYQTVKGYLTKDEIWLANYIAKGGTIEDAGTWYCTAYCTEKRRHICGTGKGITASGEPVEAFVSCALNRHNLKTYPFGTHIYIEGIGERIIMDTGGGVRQKQIDCAVDTHHNAVHWDGQGDHKVWVLKEGK